MLSRYVTQGRADALRRFGFEKLANMELGVAGMPHGAPPPAAAAGGGVRGFLGGQMGAAKDLFGNLRQGLGGAPDAAAGAAARQGAVGNLKTLAPSLLAGGGLYMMHRHHQAQQEQQARQQAMMGGGGYPMM
jgi:hypothetical protein